MTSTDEVAAFPIWSDNVKRRRQGLGECTAVSNQQRSEHICRTYSENKYGTRKQLIAAATSPIHDHLFLNLDAAAAAAAA